MTYFYHQSRVIR